ncbi:alpha/beta-hydrolase, partial [Lojkania enalia]
VSGFSGWGRPLFGTINYWGGFENLPAILARAGYKVIVARIGPVSSNRERACEIWTQLRNINNGTDRININYGSQHPAAPLGFLQRAWTWRPVLFGDFPDNWDWAWGKERPVHFVCHSQGGNSVRYLIELLTGTHTDLFPGPDFPTENHQDWVGSVVTIGTPYKGTTVTDVVQNLLPPNFLEALTRLVWSTSFDPPRSRFYDLQLDHWGFYRLEDESLSAMHTRLSNIVPFWWNSNLHGLHDNSILGVASLNDFAPDPSEHTYYFTMAFCATNPFPNRTLGQQDVNEFLALFPLNEVFNPFGVGGRALSSVFQIFSQLPFLPQLRDFAAWLTDVANRHLGSMNYFSRIPRPGSQVPRADMLPAIAVPAYAMGGYQLDQQGSRVLDHITSEEYQRNDGIVNTKSMSGPVSAEYGAGPFPGPGIDMKDMASAKRKYWYLGENATIDHADQIGVFTSENTVGSYPQSLTIVVSTPKDKTLY